MDLVEVQGKRMARLSGCIGRGTGQVDQPADFQVLPDLA